MLHYHITGSGRACVFLHGFLESMTMWNYLELSKLNGKHVFIDLPGHGKSLLEDVKNPSIDFMAEAVKDVLFKEGIRDFNIVGHSMGGYVALSLKEKMSECKKVILLNSNYWEDSQVKKKDRDRVAKIAFGAKSYFVQEAIPNLFSNHQKYQLEIDHLVAEAKLMSSEAIAYSSIAMKNRKNMSCQLDNQNYIIIHGALDSLVQKGSFDLNLIGKSHFHEINNAGHMSHIENCGEVIDVLSLYLKD